MGGGVLSWHRDLVLLDEEEGLAFAVCGFGYFSLSSFSGILSGFLWESPFFWRLRVCFCLILTEGDRRYRDSDVCKFCTNSQN
jgi:hypothetical protein